MKTGYRRRARWLPLAAALLWLPQAAGASVPATLGFEGRLETLAGGPVADGDYTLTFALYGDDKTATASWTETATVKVAAGRFSHALGSVQALAPATLDATAAGWVGVRVGQDPELPRSPLRAVAFAARAALAEGLACSGCVGVGALKFDGDIDLGGNSLKAKNATFSGDVVAKTVTATSLVGDGSKLTDVQIAGGSCKSGEVVTGVKADGSVICGAAPATTIAGGKCQAGQVVTEVKADGSVVCGAVQAALPPDGLSAISNGLLTNVFDETFAGPELPKPIPDNNPSGVLSEIVIGDIGTLQGITVSVDIETSDLSGLAVTLFDPDNNVYKLHDKSGTGTALKTTFPTPTKTASGDLTQWIGKNPKGTWRLIVADWKATAGGNDGQLKGWSLGLKVLSGKKVEVNGTLVLGPGQSASSKPTFISVNDNVNGPGLAYNKPWASTKTVLKLFKVPAKSTVVADGTYYQNKPKCIYAVNAQITIKDENDNPIPFNTRNGEISAWKSTLSGDSNYESSKSGDILLKQYFEKPTTLKIDASNSYNNAGCGSTSAGGSFTFEFLVTVN